MLILVDENDRVVGHLSKGLSHDGEGALHRAFSLFVFNREGEFLLQQRSAGKRLWSLFWSNSCCSHPREGETMDEAVRRRLLQELRLESNLQFLYKFQYQASYKDIGRRARSAGSTSALPVTRPGPIPTRLKIIAG